MLTSSKATAGSPVQVISQPSRTGPVGGTWASLAGRKAVLLGQTMKPPPTHPRRTGDGDRASCPSLSGRRDRCCVTRKGQLPLAQVKKGRTRSENELQVSPEKEGHKSGPSKAPRHDQRSALPHDRVACLFVQQVRRFATRGLRVRLPPHASGSAVPCMRRTGRPRVATVSAMGEGETPPAKGRLTREAIPGRFALLGHFRQEHRACRVHRGPVLHRYARAYGGRRVRAERRGVSSSEC
jgi:hypothetical protein